MTRATTAAGRGPSLAFLHNELRRAERDWQGHSRFDNWPGGNPWAAHRDEAAARHDRIKADIAAFGAPDDALIIPGRMRTTAAFMEGRA